jgi:hypothetical protein
MQRHNNTASPAAKLPVDAMKAMLQVEIEHRKAHGCRQVSVAEMEAEFNALGYTMDRNLDCRSMSRYLESGRSYPCCTTGLKEIDTGMSAFHFAARRDDKFRAMQKLRQEIFAVSRGATLEV